MALAEAMVAEGHSTEGEVSARIEAVLTERQKLHTPWQHKKVYLDQLIDVHFYLRDVKQILATSTAQEIALSNTECGSTIEEVEAHLKAHNAFQNLVSQQKEKVASRSGNCFLPGSRSSSCELRQVRTGSLPVSLCCKAAGSSSQG